MKRYADLIRKDKNHGIKSLWDNIVVQSMDAMEFTANYTYTSFSAVKTLANTALYYRLTLADGSKATWQGEHTCWVGEGEVNGIIEFTISVAPSTEITIESA